MSEELTPEEEIEKLKAVIAGLEGLRGTLGDEAVNGQIAPLQARIGGLQQTVTQSGELNVNIANAEGGRIRMGDMVGRDKYDVGGDMNQTDVHGDQTNVDTGGGDYKTEVHHHYAPENEDAVALRNNYLDQLLNQQNDLTLTGIDPHASSGQNGKLRLDAVYTALMVSRFSYFYRRANLPGSKGKIVRDVLWKPLSVLKAFNLTQRFTLLGSPGSGKSTFVRFVAACMAGELRRSEQINLSQLTQPLPDSDETQVWEHGALLPVIVTLRELAAMKLPNNIERGTVAHFWHYVSSKLIQPEYGKTLKHELLTHGGLLLFDGLDEVPNAAENRPFIKRMVEDVSDTFGKCRILVTSRTYAYQVEDWKLTGFDVAELQPFARAQINFFVSRWYEHLATLRQDMTAETAHGRARLLRQAIEANSRLQEFAQQPLLLTLMATLHAFHGGKLPDKRVELYEDSVQLLLDRWETSRLQQDASGEIMDQSRILHEWLSVDQDAVLNLLSRIAYAVHSTQSDDEGTADIPEQMLVMGLFELGEEAGQSINQRAIIDYVSQRAGLLISHGNKVYTFPHRTFQEYLAAVYLTEFDYPYKLAELVRNEPNRWREVTLLAGAKAGRGATAAVWLLVEMLYAQPDPEIGETEIHQLWGSLIAGELLVETIDPAQPLHRVYRDKLELAKARLIETMQSDLMPVTERALAGRLLSELGDPRPGVGLDENGFPDIKWGEIVPAGSYAIGGDKQVHRSFDAQEIEIDTAYELATYPVTYAQFQAFVEADDYDDDRWWEGMFEQQKNIFGEMNVTKQIDNQWFRFANSPRETVAWYQAVAFCRWLSDKLDFEVRLPHEYEWEVATRYNDGRKYPSGTEIDENRANYGRSVGQTTAVGMYPQGAQANLNLYDLGGNVFEWCQNKYRDPAETNVDDSGESRVLRGGSWSLSDYYVRAANRLNYLPNYRDTTLGFRVCRDSPLSLHGVL